MEPRYDHTSIEKKIYEIWQKSGFFNPDVCVEKGVTKKSAKSFSIVLPPPNVTGTLHMGHAAMLAIEDIMIRYARMKGLKTLWLPGTDHAAIATQAKVEDILSKKEGKTKYDLGREGFLKRVQDFAKESHDTIINQIERMGASVDWSREAYTLDEKRSLAVRTTFREMYEAGLIYRGNRIINWDPKGRTTISDDEVEHKAVKGKLYTFKYSKDFPISIATTRPETKLGDTAVAVNPNDKRYKAYIGKEYDVSFVGVPLKIKIVADKEIDMKFGTGAVGVTPAHSFADWDIAQRHNLPLVQVIDERARMIIDNLDFKDKKTLEAREIIVEKLKSQELLEKEEEIDQNISIAERTHGIIEPLPKLQWFIDVNKPFTAKISKIIGIKSGDKTTLKELMRKTVKNGQIDILPKRFEKVYFHWIENLRDWCISRQLWFGHRIPVWYHEPICVPIPGREKEIEKCEEIVVGQKIEKCPHCNAKFVQDEDTLDTWFSAGLWTFSTLGWPEKTDDIKTFHPTDILETGYDILFFWVARMILMTGFLLGDIPFKKVYLHGLVRDNQGRKMSKSLDNIIDPLDLIEKYGADATRLSLIIGAGPGNDMKLSEDKVKGYRNFTTKIWNASRFVILNCQSGKSRIQLTVKDRKYIKNLDSIKKKVEGYIEKYDFNRAGETLYHYFWHEFADKIIEETKPRLLSENKSDKESAQKTLITILTESLKMLHPFMPFVTEEIWSLIPEKKNLLIVEKW